MESIVATYLNNSTDCTSSKLNDQIVDTISFFLLGRGKFWYKRFTSEIDILPTSLTPNILFLNIGSACGRVDIEMLREMKIS